MRHSRKVDPDRFLVQRSGIYYYWRRVPARFVPFDTRTASGLIRTSLKTDDIAEARAKRDALESADQDYWVALTLEDGGAEQAMLRYQSVVRRVEMLGFQYRTSNEIAAGPLSELLARVIAILPDGTAPEKEAAVLGREQRPGVGWWEVYEIYKTKIMRAELAKKSAGQIKIWESTRKRAIAEFIKLVGDIPIASVTRNHASAFYDQWLEKVLPEDRHARRMSPSSANKELGTLRSIYDRFHRRLADWEKVENNPFKGLSFSDSDTKRAWPPFSSAWIQDVILVPGALAGMGKQLRGITLVLLESGCRPAEVCNIAPCDIHLDAEVPYIHIRARDDPDDTRDIKTAQSDRVIPLVGVALEVFTRHPDGFPQYKDKENSYSAAANKFFAENGLKETKKHVMYSFRHSFEDRMVEAGIDLEVRQVLMGHQLDRPEYGEKGSLAFKQRLLKKMAFRFDPSIV